MNSPAMTGEQRSQFVGGLLCAATGVVTGIFVYLNPQNLKAPAWVAFVACLCFVLMGASLVAAACERTRLQQWLGFLGGVALFSPGAWLAFGSGVGECSVSLPFFSRVASEYVCRTAFGVGTAIGVLILCVLGWRATKSWRSGR